MNPDPNQPSVPTDQPAPADQPAPTPQPPVEPSVPPMGGGEPQAPVSGAPVVEEKCTTCGNQASNGACTPCSQPMATCTCPTQV